MKAIYIAPLSALLTLSGICSAQYWQPKAQNVLTNNFGVFSISTPNAKTIWAVANDPQAFAGPQNHTPQIIKSTDNGETWNTYTIDSAAGSVSMDLHAFNKDTAIVQFNDMAFHPKLFRTTDGGASWTKVLEDSSAGIWLRFFNDQDGICILGHFMSVTSDGGKTWSRVPRKNIPSFATGEYATFASGTNSCATFGDHIWMPTTKNRVFHSADKGMHWEATEVSKYPELGFSSIVFRDAQHGIVMGHDNNKSAFYETQDGGKTWTPVETNETVWISNMTLIPGTQTLVASAWFNITSGAYSSKMSMDFGKTWFDLDYSRPYGSIAFADAQNGWMANGLVLSTSDPALYKFDPTFSSLHATETNGEIAVYPNPTNGTLHLRMPEHVQKSVSYAIIDASGKVVLRDYAQAGMNRISVDHLKDGIYILKTLDMEECNSIRFVKN